MYEPQGELYYNQQQQPVVTQEQVAGYLAKVMGWMCTGLLTTMVCALLFATFEPLMYMIYSTNFVFFIVIAQLVVAIGMSTAIRKISASVATVLFMVYSALTGVTLSVFFLMFELSSLISVFGLTAGIFLCMAVYGVTTKRDLTSMGTLCIFGLIGIIAGSLLNVFLGNTMVDLLITCVGIVIFIGLTAYDTQRIKGIYVNAVLSGHDAEGDLVRKVAIFGAFSLYLDFINLFLKLLRLLGRRR